MEITQKYIVEDNSVVLGAYMGHICLIFECKQDIMPTEVVIKFSCSKQSISKCQLNTVRFPTKAAFLYKYCNKKCTAEDG